jgi:ankyrin repeat protein
MVGLLLEAGADVDSRSLYQSLYGTPLEVARNLGHAEIAQLLIEHGATD